MSERIRPARTVTEGGVVLAPPETSLAFLTNSGHPLFVQGEMSERIRPARTVTEAPAYLTGAEKITQLLLA